MAVVQRAQTVPRDVWTELDGTGVEVLIPSAAPKDPPVNLVVRRKPDDGQPGSAP